MIDVSVSHVVPVVVAALLVWIWPPTRGSRLLRGCSVAAGLMLLWTMVAPDPGQTLEQRAADGYRATWDRLEQAAGKLSQALSAVEFQSNGLRLELFRLLQANAEVLDDPVLGGRATALIFDADGEAVAWHGPGMLHEPSTGAWSEDGRSWHQADTSISLWTTTTPAHATPGWRLVVGISFALQPFPFAAPTGPVDWALADPGATPPAGYAVLGRDAPVLWMRSGEGTDLGGQEHDAVGGQKHDADAGGLDWTARTAIFSWAIILLWGALHLLVPSDRPWGMPKWAARGWACALSVLGSWGVAAAGGSTPSAALIAAVATGGLAWILAVKIGGQQETAGPPREARGILQRWWPCLQGGLGFMGLVLVAWLAQGHLGPMNLSGEQGLSPDAVALRWAFGALALGVLLTLPTGRGPTRTLLPIAWSGLLVAAAGHDHPWLAISAAVFGSIGFSLWWSRTDERGSPARLGVLALAASLMAGCAWQIAERAVLRQQIAEVYLPLVVPPVDDDLNGILLELQAHFETRDPVQARWSGQATAPSSSREDLAFRLWLQSPLPKRDGLSALVVEGFDGRRSSFSFGLPLGDDGEPLPGVGRLRVPQTPSWTEKVYGEVELYDEQSSWEGRIRYWFLPRPGFRIGNNELEELERNLVREKPRGDTADGLPRGVEYAYFSPAGRALAGPWETLPPLPAELIERGAARGRVETPDGPSLCWIEGDDEGLTVLFLPILDPRSGLERVGFVALTMFPALMAVAWLIWLIPSTRTGLMELLRDSLRSYSKRLILVYTVLLLVPLVTLNLILLRSFSERLQQEQLNDAQRAMVSARELLVNFLNGLEPGIAIETHVNRALLEWMSDLVQHQVNLYWGSLIFQSSQQELFTSGLLPRRIPGEIFTRLTLLGHGMELRRRRAGDLAYLEIYAPLDVPGVVSSQKELFVSVPLLEKEEAAERQLHALQRRALLVTSALFGLLLAVGSRLTRGFTRPIVELIAGTRSIARGEPFPEVRPKETELSALAEAIATMARQVDESRRGLVQEKRFVERVVANITSAVVSLDHEYRVAFQNDVARDLLGTKLGEPIEQRLAADEMLSPLREFWLAARENKAQAVAQVKLRPGGETVDIREWTLTWVPIPGDADPAALLVVDDDTETLRGQRLEAWAEMARIIAHEIKNPLTPIQLSAEHLRQVRRSQPDRFDEIFDRCTDNILSNVAELRAIASEFSIYSRIPAAKLESADLGEAMAELAASYRDAAEHGVSMELVSPEQPVIARFDEKLLGRAVRNLLENAYRAAAPTQGTVELRVRVEGGEHEPETAVVEVCDSGPGVDPQKLNRIFEPYFSTYETGTGLGLAIVRRIVDEHGGEVGARNRPGGGLSVIIRIPLAAPTLDATAAG